MNLNLRNTGGVRIRRSGTLEENAKLNRQGTRLLILYAFCFISFVAIMWNLERIKHVLTGSADRSSLIIGTWVGRVSWSDESPDRWEMPADGSGTWAVMIDTSHSFFSSFDAVQGNLSVCSDKGVHSGAVIRPSDLTNGVADLEVSQHPPTTFPIRVTSVYVKPQAGRLVFSGSLLHGDLRGVLHRGVAADFQHLCR